MGPEHRHGGSNGWMFLAMAVSVVAVIGGMGGITSRLGPASIPIWGMVMVGGFLISRGPIGQAIARRIAGEVDPEGPAVVDVPEAVYAELDELRARVAELEERQDFSERLLAQRNDVKDAAT